MLTLKVLGGAAVHGPDGPLTGRIGQRRRLALLTVLALGGARATSRDRLIAFLWPESDAERARHSLADALYQLRRELGERAVVSRGDEVALDPELVDSDAGAFERAVARGDLPGAVALYGGPLLDGFHLPDAPEFERWVDGRRAELARSYAAALDRLATEAAARGDGSQAVEWARRLCALDPYNARATLRLMSALDAAGDRAGAIRQARVHAVMLEHELGAAPDAEIEALAERLRRGEPAEPATLGAEAAPPPVAAMGAESVPSPMLADAGAARDGVLPPRPRRARRWVAATPLAALAIVLVAVLAYAGRFVRAESREAIDGADLGPDGRAVVVLPCANLGGVASEEHFSDGLTDELTTLLARVHSLRVVARTSALGFKGSRLDVREIARRLDADVLVECGVRRAGERFRITAQLVNGADGMHLWADTYQGEGSDLIAIQSDLALRIVRALEARLTPRERTRLAHRSTAHPEAHALYLKGRHFWNQRTPASVERAIEYFTRAIAIDSQYAAAYAGLARAYSL
ncbi:MAG TPA: BTAD domain-containing putative transcriptional regulator, partial [Gemmatimonadaceae bacterium]|nr:BTAD domain-containing putative transcriptional regulator [Gemmatimonadaceae bacterium]